jgi:hypothetical protein
MGVVHQIFPGGTDKGAPVDAAVLVKAFVLGHQQRVAHGRGQCA